MRRHHKIVSPQGKSTFITNCGLFAMLAAHTRPSVCDLVYHIIQAEISINKKNQIININQQVLDGVP